MTLLVAWCWPGGVDVRSGLLCWLVLCDLTGGLILQRIPVLDLPVVLFNGCSGDCCFSLGSRVSAFLDGARPLSLSPCNTEKNECTWVCWRIEAHVQKLE